MKLSDLLTSYKQVEGPKTVNTIDTTPSTKYSRFVDYVDSKKGNTSTETTETPETQTMGWQGWSYSGNSNVPGPVSTQTSSSTPAPTQTPTQTSTPTPIQTPVTPRTNTIRAIQTANKDAYDKFVSDFDTYLKTNSQYAADRDVLTSIAALESGYKPSVSNKHSGALGYFQFLDSTRSEYNNSTREQFANDTNQQFDAAARHYANIKRQLSRYQNEIKNSGLSDLQVAYGMWWRPGSMLNYLRTGKDDYVNKSDGMTLEKILQRAN